MAGESQTRTTPDPGLQALLALLARTLPKPTDVAALREAIAQVAEDDPLVQAVSECIAALRDQAARLKQAVPAPGLGETQPLPAFDFHQKPTMAIPALGVFEPGAATAPVPAQPEVHWSPSERMLYEDILTLFELGDQPGAMTSVERLLMLSPQAKELDAFFERNEPTLKKVYEDYFGSLDRIPVPVRNAHPIKIPTPDPAVVMDILRLVDGRRTLREVVRRSKMNEVRTLVALAHLARSGFIELA